MEPPQSLNWNRRSNDEHMQPNQYIRIVFKTMAESEGEGIEILKKYVQNCRCLRTQREDHAIALITRVPLPTRIVAAFLFIG